MQKASKDVQKHLHPEQKLNYASAQQTKAGEGSRLDVNNQVHQGQKSLSKKIKKEISSYTRSDVEPGPRQKKI